MTLLLNRDITRIILALIIGLLPSLVNAQKLELVGFENSECNEELDPYRLKTRIISKQFVGDTLAIRIGMVDTCGFEFTPTFKYSQDTISLGIGKHGTGEECICCYELVYRIIGMNHLNTPITFKSKLILESNEKYWTTPIKYFVFKGDTTGYIDKYGLKQGMYIREKNGKLIEIHCKDDEFIKVRVRDLNGNLILESNDLLEIYDL